MADTDHCQTTSPHVILQHPHGTGWLHNATETLPTLPPSQALDLILRYDLAYRLTYHRAPSSTLIDQYILQAFDAHIHGDRDIDPYTLYRAIDTPIRHSNPLYLDKPLQWWAQSLDRWYRQATGARKPQPDESLYDRLSQTAILLQADLWAYRPTDQHLFKQQLAARYRETIETPSADAPDPRISQAIRLLAAAARPYLYNNL